MKILLRFETNNGISAQAQGTPRDFGGNPPVVPVVSQGSFAWTSPEGQPIVITYIADENGYQPQVKVWSIIFKGEFLFGFCEYIKHKIN